MYVLGISRHHDSAAALVRDGEIVAFAEEERFSRVKHDGRFPTKAIAWCLQHAGITLGDVDHVAYFWQRWREPMHAAKVFARYFPATLEVFRNAKGDQGGRAQGMLDTLRHGGRGIDDYHVGGAVLGHVKRGYTLGRDVRRALGYDGPTRFKVHLVDHHRAHAASTFFISPWDEAAILTLDGIGSDGRRRAGKRIRRAPARRERGARPQALPCRRCLPLRSPGPPPRPRSRTRPLSRPTRPTAGARPSIRRPYSNLAPGSCLVRFAFSSPNPASMAMTAAPRWWPRRSGMPEWRSSTRDSIRRPR